MSFQLQIEFSGLCLFLKHRDGHRVGVVMPDARMPADGVWHRHSDHTKAVPHAGYIRYDLAALVPSADQVDFAPLTPSAPHAYAGPRFEVVHRFDREELDLGLDRGPVTINELSLPDFTRISSKLSAKRGLMGNDPPRELLMRMVLHGGEFSSHSGGTNWTFPSTKNGKHAYQGQFASITTWTQTIRDRAAITLTLQSFDGGEPTALTLRPVNGVVRLKICNLCAENPLEWPELKMRTILTDEDKDFKWLYRLLDNTEEVLIDHAGNPQHLPVPVLDRTNMVAGEEQDCAGGEIDDDNW